MGVTGVREGDRERACSCSGHECCGWVPLTCIAEGEKLREGGGSWGGVVGGCQWASGLWRTSQVVPRWVCFGAV